ncbi:glycosyltransferase [Jannaschia aquimarina]|uniref:Beta-monoglucosyldiacylglycerol synthase n=1 Tax=Jannaschia aquimarina TaxID=935700 RepID=A0A0D1CTB9_9RHOB|nr:glycosyltransferase [Jannaschia aquimarina]KIT18017.1 Beta-monoglucosyldiacylglycerol synthase [Jannaschia aquimarina]SNS88627.1 Glycosyltransferase, catalytic subunit of cellulose synthase and poly-beta-1,6-N-acetylglucosamine synthase [Jannaschia aquimarina]
MLAREQGARLGEILRSEGMVEGRDLDRALARQAGLGHIDRLPPPDAASLAVARKLPLEIALRHRAVPIRSAACTPVIATPFPERAQILRTELPRDLSDAPIVAASAQLVDARISEAHGAALARQAECRAPRRESCRDWRGQSVGIWISAALIALLSCALTWPRATLAALMGVALLAMLGNLGLRAAAIRALRSGRHPGFRSVRSDRLPDERLPRISILIPLHDEPEIAPALIRRMERLDYPRSRLEILLVVEENDEATRTALADATLPAWMRVIPVPEGQPHTKPRAMNYALNFATGDVIGVYDAEDAPSTDQLRKVATRFVHGGERLACLQGRLDYYNATRNWMARGFTIEYAAWFRLLLPGIARMGLVVPLGGTTVFFRRNALEEVGAWDAHNVTEDADLGVRLTRRGWRTEVIDVTTLEEANAAPLPWINQRSRWMKGYLMTWAVHSARPLHLWRDLGPRRFWFFHLHFLSAVLNALLMPLAWTLVVIPFGLPHPAVDGMPVWVSYGLGVGLPLLTVANWGMAAYACRAPHHRHLRRSIPLLEPYFALASLAVLKAVAELVLKPFHWDKTAHGVFGGAGLDEAAPER